MARLGSLVEQIRGVSYKPEDVCNELNENSVALLRANNIKDGQLNFDDVIYIDKKRVHSNQLLRAGDTLICTSSGSKELVGKAAYVQKDLPLTFGAFCKVVRPKKICPEYLGHFFNSPNYRKKISDLSAGININNIRNEHIDNLEILVPELDKQNYIIDVLNKVNALIFLRRKQLIKLDKLVKTRFVEMFENKEFDTAEFGDICKFLRNGANIKQSKGAGGYPITRIETLSNDVFNTDRLGYADIYDLVKYDNFILKPGDILISHINSTAYLGRAVQYKGKMDTPIIHGMNLLCARIIETVNPTYVEWLFKMPITRQYIFRITKKAVNQASITTTDLKKLPISVPPILLQEQFADLAKQVDKSKLTIQQSLDKLKVLKNSLMQEYFG